MADNYISKVKLPGDEKIYFVKDTEARELIADLQANGVSFVVSTSAATTPYGVKWTSEGTEITGTLAASKDTKQYIYLVPTKNSSGSDIYDEYVTVESSTTPVSYSWERLGNTEINFNDLGNLAYADTVDVSYTKVKDITATVTLPTGYTFTGTTNMPVNVTGSYTPYAYSAVTKYLTAAATNGSITVGSTVNAVTSYDNPTTVEFIKSYSGSTSKLDQTTVNSAGDSVTIPNVTGNTSVTATKVDFGTDVTASKATAGDTYDVAKVGSSTTIYGVPSTTTSVISTVSVDAELLSFNSVTPASTTFTPAAEGHSITQYTFADVTVPNITSHADVEASKVSLGTAISAAGPATAVTVATGAVSTDGSGSSVLIGLGTASKESAITELGTPTTDTALKTVSLVQPTITLSTADTTSSGAVEYVQAVNETTGTAVTISSSGTITPTGTISETSTTKNVTVDVSYSEETGSTIGTPTAK